MREDGTVLTGRASYGVSEPSTLVRTLHRALRRGSERRGISRLLSTLCIARYSAGRNGSAYVAMGAPCCSRT